MNLKAHNRLGLVSGNLAPYVKSILGVDISQGVVDLFNKRFVDKDADQKRFRAIRAELKGEEGELDNERFHVIIVRRKLQVPLDPFPQNPIRIYSALQRITISKRFLKSLNFWLISLNPQEPSSSSTTWKPWCQKNIVTSSHIGTVLTKMKSRRFLVTQD